MEKVLCALFELMECIDPRSFPLSNTSMGIVSGSTLDLLLSGTKVTLLRGASRGDIAPSAICALALAVAPLKLRCCSSICRRRLDRDIPDFEIIGSASLSFSSLLTITVVISGIFRCPSATPQSSLPILLNLGDVYNACLI
jgi:hypothetical protein